MKRAYVRAKDRIGTIIKNFKILDYKRENGETYFYIECLLCGNKKWMKGSEVTSGKSVSCGCYNKNNNLKKSEDLTGQKFGELTVLKATEKRSRNGSVIWECKCSCRNYVSVSSQRLKDGSVKSCGCLRSKISTKKAEKMAEIILEGCIEDTNIRNLTSKTPKNNTSGYKGVSWDKERQKWAAQIVFQGKTYNLGRYYKKEDAISAREEAEEKLFGEFLNDHEIEVNKTEKNKKNKKEIEDYNGVTYSSIEEMCRIHKVPYNVYISRLKIGWTQKKALETPYGCTDHLGNWFKNEKEMAKAHGVNYATYRYRKDRGDDLEKRLNPKKEPKHFKIVNNYQFVNEKECTDHTGKKFNSIKEMCEFWGIACDTYCQRLHRGKTLEEALTTPVKKNKKQEQRKQENKEINVYEITTKVALLKEIEIKQLRRNLVYFIDSILVKDDVYKEFHGENKLKGYTLDLLYPMEKNRVYKKDKVYSFRVRTLNKDLAEYLSKNSIQHITNEFIGIQSIVKIIPRKPLKTLYTMTPVIVKTQEHCYWRECFSPEEYEEQLKKNLWKKYRNFTGKEPDESLPIWDSLVFKNQGVIPFPYKNITLPGDKLELFISNNEQAQEIAYMILATGLGELNNRGAGFVGYRYKDGIKNE